jgi:glyoxylase-like metal-dependent hydrolase (beta-lactamase superfamily II)
LSTPPEKPPFPSDAWPTETFTERRRTLYFNGDGLEVLHEPAAHSDGDAIIFFRRSDVIVAGDIIDTLHFPTIQVANGGSIQGEIDALNKIVEMAIRPIPFVFEEGGTIVVPGHGRLLDHADSVEYRDMVVIVRDTVQDMMERGMTLDQIKAASPAKQYEPRYGAKSGSWTTNDFIEAIYKSLQTKK